MVTVKFPAKRSEAEKNVCRCTGSVGGWGRGRYELSRRVGESEGGTYAVHEIRDESRINSTGKRLLSRSRDLNSINYPHTNQSAFTPAQSTPNKKSRIEGSQEREGLTGSSSRSNRNDHTRSTERHSEYFVQSSSSE